MRWSKLKQSIEGLFAEGVRGRITLHTTRYRKAHDRFGRSCIRVDGRELISMCNYLRCGDGIADGNVGRFEAGVFAGYDLPLAMREFLTLSIDRAVASANPLIRSLAALDRRTSRRQLSHLEAETELPIVRELAEFRRQASTADAILLSR